jgi:zinc transporter
MSDTFEIEDPCLVFALELDNSGGASPLLSLSAENPQWLHLDYSYSNASDILQHIGIPETVVAALIRPDTRPRTLAFPEGTLVFLRGINFNPGDDPEDMVSIRMWIEANRLVTVRQRKLLSAQDIRADLESGLGPHSIEHLITQLISRIADRVSTFVEGLDERLSQLEEGFAENIDSSARSQISAIRRQAAEVRRYLAPQKEALDGLYRNIASMSRHDFANELREQADRNTRYIEELDLLRERAMVLNEELQNLVAQEQNNRMYVLSIVSIIFLPITFVSGVFGMNVAGLPGVTNVSSFWIVAASMLVVSLAVIVGLKIKKWF